MRPYTLPIVLLSLILGLACCFPAGREECQPDPVPAVVEKPKPISRDEFKKLAMGKSELEMIDTFGKPDLTSSSGSTNYWFYEKRTLDQFSGKTDHYAQVVLEKAVVIRVNFN